MSDTFRQIVDLVQRGEVKISEHGYDEIAEDGLFVRDIVSGVSNGRLIEDYPDFPKGPCVLVLQNDRNGTPIHNEHKASHKTRSRRTVCRRG